MRFRILILVVVLVAVQGCSSGPEISFDDVWTCNIDAVKSDVSDFVDGIYYILLYSDADAMFKNADKLIIENDLIYIADYKSKKIIAYGMDGSVGFVLDRLGRGPGEYLEIKSFTVNDACLYILDNFNRKVFVYDSFNGQFIRSEDLDFIAWDMEALGNGGFIFAFSPMAGGRLRQPQTPGRIIVTDDEIDVESFVFNYEPKEYDVVGQQRYFSTYGDRLIYSSIFFDGFVVFDRFDAEIKDIIGIEFDNPIPAGSRNDRSVLDGNFNYMCSIPIICDNYSVIEVSTGMYVESLLYDSYTGTFFKNDDDNYFRSLYYPMSSTDGCFVCLMDFVVYKELVSGGFECAEPSVEAHLSEGNFVLAFYRMK